MRDLTPCIRHHSAKEQLLGMRREGLRAPVGLGEPEICLPKIRILETGTYYGKL